LLKRAGLAFVGLVVACAALEVGARLGGPAVRSLFGEPTGFLSDVTTGPALAQASLVLFVFVIVAFVSLGALLSRHPRRLTRSDAWWVANPLSMFTAFFVHFILGNQVDWWVQLPYEYVSTVAWTLHTFVGPPVYVLLLLIGASGREWLSNRRLRDAAQQ